MGSRIRCIILLFGAWNVARLMAIDLSMRRFHNLETGFTAKISRVQSWSKIVSRSSVISKTLATAMEMLIDDLRACESSWRCCRIHEGYLEDQSRGRDAPRIVEDRALLSADRVGGASNSRSRSGLMHASYHASVSESHLLIFPHVIQILVTIYTSPEPLPQSFLLHHCQHQHNWQLPYACPK